MREVSELTGESPSCLFRWGKQHKNVGSLLGSRQTFYNNLKRNEWQRRSPGTSTQNCRLGSCPLACELRIRIYSVEVQSPRDAAKQEKRQMIFLYGYETCSQLMNVKIYRSTFTENADNKGTNWICNTLKANVVAAFILDCARMVGLPISQIIFTNSIRINEHSKNKNDDEHLIIKETEKLLEKSNFTIGNRDTPKEKYKKSKEISNNIRIRNIKIAGRSTSSNLKFKFEQECLPHFQLEHPFSRLASCYSSTKLSEMICQIVNDHNKLNSIDKLLKGRAQLRNIVQKIKSKKTDGLFGHRRSNFEIGLSNLVDEHQICSPHDIQFARRNSENFDSEPGDLYSQIDQSITEAD